MPDQSIVEELKRRGLLATGGNIRSLPFDESEAQGNAATTPNPVAASGVTQNPDGTVNATDVQGNAVTVDPKNITPEQADTLSDDSINGLLPFLTGVVGGVIAQRLMSRKKGVPPVGPDGVPIVEGEVMPRDPLAALPGDAIEEGEFTEVPKQLTGGQRGINGPADNLALPAPQPALEGATAQELARRKAAAQSVQPVEASRIALPDAYSDFTPEELAKARTIAEELVRQRQRGNVKSFSRNKQYAKTAGRPTSPGRKTETIDNMMGNVVKVLRDQKALQALRKSVP